MADLEPDVLRAALYIDGFNLYHPIVEKGWNHLKWCSLWKLGEIICEKGKQKLVKVTFCTAVPKIDFDAGKHDRHKIFNAAQIANGVDVILGHYVPEPTDAGHQKWTEKQTDINVALQLILDGLDDVYDVAFLLSADTDQVATARVFSERLSGNGKRLIGVSPPGRKTPAGYGKYKIPGLQITEYMLERAVMPREVNGANGMIIRPDNYEPDPAWMHPDDRPKNKTPKSPKKWSKAYKA